MSDIAGFHSLKAGSHCFFVKLHRSRTEEDALPKNKTLFVTNIPHHATVRIAVADRAQDAQGASDSLFDVGMYDDVLIVFAWCLFSVFILVTCSYSSFFVCL
jgi:hypothetical protein